MCVLDVERDGKPYLVADRRNPFNQGVTRETATQRLEDPRRLSPHPADPNRNYYEPHGQAEGKTPTVKFTMATWEFKQLVALGP